MKFIEFLTFQKVIKTFVLFFIKKVNWGVRKMITLLTIERKRNSIWRIIPKEKTCKSYQLEGQKTIITKRYIQLYLAAIFKDV